MTQTPLHYLSQIITNHITTDLCSVDPKEHFKMICIILGLPSPRARTSGPAEGYATHSSTASMFGRRSNTSDKLGKKSQFIQDSV